MKNPARGFTLIELLIALGLMAIFALLAYRGLDSVLRLDRAAQDHDGVAAARLRVMTQLEADLRQANSVSIVQVAGAQTLQLTRRTVDADGAGTVTAVSWDAKDGILSRRTQDGVAQMIKQVTQLEWWVHQSTPVPTSQPWLSFAAQTASGGEVKRAVMLHLSQQGQQFEKAFLIGR